MALPTSEKMGQPWWSRWVDGVLLWSRMVRRAALAAVEHDALTVAQATAYSAMVALFPALIVAAAFISFVPDTAPLRLQMAQFFNQVLPSNVSPLLEMYFSPAHKSAHTVRALLGALVVSVTGASSVMSTLMEGFRRAYELPLTRRSFWPRQGAIAGTGAGVADSAGGGECAGGVWPFDLAVAGGRGDADAADAGAGDLVCAAVDRCVRRERGDYCGDLSPGHGFNQAHARTSGATVAGAVGDSAQGLDAGGRVCRERRWRRCSGW